MHELSVAEHILEIAVRHAVAAGAARVSDVYLVIGQLASIVDDSVQFYWPFVAAGTVAEGAKLHFRRIPARFNCRQCGQEYGLAPDFACTSCGGLAFDIVAGEEFHLEAIDVVKAEHEGAAAS